MSEIPPHYVTRSVHISMIFADFSDKIKTNSRARLMLLVAFFVLGDPKNQACEFLNAPPNNSDFFEIFGDLLSVLMKVIKENLLKIA